MLDEVKKCLRITDNSFDNEINGLINACKTDLEISGISLLVINSSLGSLIKRAIITYCKANFGFDNPDYDKLLSAYESLKSRLYLAVEYNNESVVEEEE